MELRYRYFFGGDWNPFEKEVSSAYSKLTEERDIKDPKHEMAIEEVFPELDSWSDYVVAESKSTFWRMERCICKYEDDTVSFIEELWRNALREHKVGEWLSQSEADDAEKAMCYYMANIHKRFNPSDNTVDFRLYFPQSGDGKRVNEDLTPYED